MEGDKGVGQYKGSCCQWRIGCVQPGLLVGRTAWTRVIPGEHKGCGWAWVLKKGLKKALKRVNPLKRVLFWVNPLFWVLKKAFKRVDLLKRVLKKGLFWVIHSKQCSKEGDTQLSAQKSAHKSGSLKKVLKRALPRLNPLKVVAERESRSKKSSKE